MSTNNVTLVWQDINLIEKGHKIYRSDSPMDVNNMPTALATLGKNTSRYEDKNLPIGNTYYYRVSAFIDSHEMISGEISVTVKEQIEIFITMDNDIITNKISLDGLLVSTRNNTFIDTTRFAIPDDNNYAYVSHGNNISKLDKSNNTVWSYEGHTAIVNDLSVSINNILLSGSNDKTAKMIDMGDGSLLGSYTDTYNVASVSISDFNVFNIIGNDNGDVISLDSNMNQLWSVKPHTSKITSIIANDNGYVLTASLDGVVRKINADNGNIQWSYSNTGAGGFNDVTESLDGTVYAVGGDGKLYSITDGSLNWSKVNHTGKALGVDRDDQNFIYTVGEDGKIVLTDSDSNLVWEYTEYNGVINSVRVSSNYVPPTVTNVEGTVFTLKSPNNTDETDISGDASIFTLKSPNNTDETDISGDASIFTLKAEIIQQ